MEDSAFQFSKLESNRGANRGVREMSNYPVKEYVVYRSPHGQILIDWNETLWEFGYPPLQRAPVQNWNAGCVRDA